MKYFEEYDDYLINKDLKKEKIDFYIQKNGEFNLIPIVGNEKFVENRIIYSLSKWVDEGTNQLLFFRQIVYDSIGIAEFLNPEKCLIFTKSLILFLQSFKHFDPIFSERLRDLTKKYFDLVKDDKSLKLIQKEEPFTEQLIAAEKFLELCTDDQNNDWFEIHPDNLNREIQVEAIADFLKDLKRNNQTTDTEKQDILLQKARSWLLLRYDLKKAAKYQITNSFLQKFFLYSPELIALITILSLRFINADFWKSVNPPVFSILNRSISNFALLMGYTILIILAVFLIKKIKPRKNQTQILLPRLIAGIIVGYFALMSDEAWNGLFSKFVRFTFTQDTNVFSWFIFWGKILIPLFFVYIYLLVEMSNIKGINKIKTKALRILVRGYSYSLIIGVIISDIFGSNLLDRIHQGDQFLHIYYNGVFGNIYPEAVLLLSPLALFIGIFLHLLWEDKAITEKI